MPRMPSARAFLTSTLLATLATAGSAAADPAAPAAPTSPLRFPSLAPDGAVSEVAAEVAIGIYDGADVNLYSTHLSAQFVTPDRIGGYARVSAMSLDDAGWEGWVLDAANSNITDDPGLGSIAWESPDATPGGVVAGAGATGGNCEPTDYIGAVDPAGDNWTAASWINYDAG